MTVNTVKLFLDPKPDFRMFATKAVKSSTGNVFRYLETLEAEIERLENGDAMFDGYQSYFSWMGGMQGLPLGEVLAKFTIGSPLWAAVFTRDGLRVAT